MPIQILIVDDQQIFRAGLAALLAEMKDVQVVREAGNGRQALDVVHTTLVDLILMDVVMPGMDGIEATRSICKSNPKVKVLILSHYSTEEYILQALRAGAKGYMLKDTAMKELETAIRVVMSGDTYISQKVNQSLVHYVQQNEPEKDPEALNCLTPRQRQVFMLMMEGLSVQRIAQFMGISTQRVDLYRYQILQRLDVQNTGDLMQFAKKEGLTRTTN